MTRINYVNKAFSADHLAVVAQANEICATYQAQGYDLTLRQLYYQFVARDLIANTQQSYKRLGSIVNDGRLAGLIDWDFIVDRTRNVRSVSTWTSPGSVMGSAAAGYRRDLWADQDNYIEVWIEKDALIGVIEGPCDTLRVPFFSCRGYTSQSELWGAAQRIGAQAAAGKNVHVIHLGDHDPSGIDMTRDITDRLALFCQHDFWTTRLSVYAARTGDASTEGLRAHADDVDGEYRPVKVHRVALNRDQIDQHDPPPNPAKLSDARAAGYVAEHGYDSWELDALEPTVLSQLITDNVGDLIDWDRWEASSDEEEQERALLRTAARRWDDVRALLDTGGAA